MYRRRSCSLPRNPKTVREAAEKVSTFKHWATMRVVGANAPAEMRGYVIYENSNILRLAAKMEKETVLFIDATFSITPRLFYQEKYKKY